MMKRKLKATSKKGAARLQYALPGLSVMRTRKQKEKLNNDILFDGRSLSRYVDDLCRRYPKKADMFRCIIVLIIFMLAEVGIIHVVGMWMGVW